MARHVRHQRAGHASRHQGCAAAAAPVAGCDGRDITSIAAFLVYEGGAGYTAAKHAEQALSDTLRLELNGERIRVVDVAPGMVQTEGFSLVALPRRRVQGCGRLRRGRPSADAQDVAECVAFCVRLPQHVNIDRLVVKPVAQAAPHKLHRGPIDWGEGGSDA